MALVIVTWLDQDPVPAVMFILSSGAAPSMHAWICADVLSAEQLHVGLDPVQAARELSAGPKRPKHNKPVPRNSLDAPPLIRAAAAFR